METFRELLLPLYLVAEENEDAPRALVEEAVDLIGWEGQELCQFPHQLYGTEFIQRNLLIKAWGVGSTGVEISAGRGPEGVPDTRTWWQPHGGGRGEGVKKEKGS